VLVPALAQVLELVPVRLQWRVPEQASVLE